MTDKIFEEEQRIMRLIENELNNWDLVPMGGEDRLVTRANLAFLIYHEIKDELK
jgi:hypothetical protein